MKKYAVISVHDLAPYYHNELKEIFEALDRLEIMHRSHLVVPDFAHQYLISKFPDFNQMVLDEKAKGAEISLHGIHHEYAEFYRNDADTVVQNMHKAYQIFVDTYNFVPPGFVAPQWLQRKESLQCVREMNFEYTETLSAFMPRDGKKRHAFPYNYDWGIVWIDHVISAMNRLRLATNMRSLIRVALHPMDVRNHLLPKAVRHIEILKANGWEFVTAQDLAKEKNS